MASSNKIQIRVSSSVAQFLQSNAPTKVRNIVAGGIDKTWGRGSSRIMEVTPAQGRAVHQALVNGVEAAPTNLRQLLRRNTEQVEAALASA
jgi:hypothetical protein